MIDFHCHLDLYKDPISLLPEVERRCEFVLAVTTSPRAWAKTSKVFRDAKNVATAIGLHPEILADRIGECSDLMGGIQKTPFIGEVGIDGSPQYADSINLQEEVLCDVIQESEKCGGRIISVHSRNAATKVLDVVERYADKSIVVLHWFSGSVKELERAIELGVWFSINPIMTFGNKGRFAIAKMPRSRILPETDAPFAQNKGIPYMPWDTSIVIRQLAKLFDKKDTDIKNKMTENLRRILAFSKTVTSLEGADMEGCS